MPMLPLVGGRVEQYVHESQCRQEGMHKELWLTQSLGVRIILGSLRQGFHELNWRKAFFGNDEVCKGKYVFVRQHSNGAKHSGHWCLMHFLDGRSVTEWFSRWKNDWWKLLYIIQSVFHGSKRHYTCMEEQQARVTIVCTLYVYAY